MRFAEEISERKKHSHEKNSRIEERQQESKVVHTIIKKTDKELKSSKIRQTCSKCIRIIIFLVQRI
jgi:hypothetical protein